MPASERPISILLVEDSPGDVVLTREALRESGVAHHLSVVRDGAEALDFLRGRGAHDEPARPDLVLLDLNLPKLHGHEVLAAIRADPELRRIPVLILTGSQREADVLDSYDLKANGFLSKPVVVDEFLRVVGDMDELSLTVIKLPWHRDDLRD